MLLTVLHSVAKQPITTAKSHYYSYFGGNHGYKECISQVIFNAAKGIIFLYILANEKSFVCLCFISRQCKMQNM